MAHSGPNWSEDRGQKRRGGAMRRRAAGEGSMEKKREAKQKMKAHKARGQVEMMRAQEHNIRGEPLHQEGVID